MDNLPRRSAEHLKPSTHTHPAPLLPLQVVHRELGIAGSYTMEASLGGSSTTRMHFNVRSYLSQGHDLCRCAKVWEAWWPPWCAGLQGVPQLGPC